MAYYELKRKECLPKILEFVFDRDDLDASMVESGVRTKADYQPVLSLLYELLDDIEGDESERIRLILGITVFRAYHQKLLSSRNKDNRIAACKYYSHIIDLTDKEYERLEKMLGDSSVLVIHSAASAIMSSPNVIRRIHALAAVSRRKSISRLAILELLNEYHHTDKDQMDEEAEQLLHLIKADHIQTDHLAIIIKGICDIGYVSIIDELYLLIENGFADDRELVLEALIYTIGRFQYGIVVDQILQKYQDDRRPRIRRACAEMLESLVDPLYGPNLLKLAMDQEFSVRIKSVYALAALGPEGTEYLKVLQKESPENRLMIQSIVSEVTQN